MPQDLHSWISDNPKFQKLVRGRSRFAWTLSILMLLVYQGFILLVAFDRGFLSTPISSGSTITWGIPIGLGVILFAFVLTGIYVLVANSRYDEINRQLVEEVTK